MQTEFAGQIPIAQACLALFLPYAILADSKPDLINLCVGARHGDSQPVRAVDLQPAV